MEIIYLYVETQYLEDYNWDDGLPYFKFKGGDSFVVEVNRSKIGQVIGFLKTHLENINNSGSCTYIRTIEPFHSLMELNEEHPKDEYESRFYITQVDNAGLVCHWEPMPDVGQPKVKQGQWTRGSLKHVRAVEDAV